VIFYAGVPLLTKEGLPLGTLCVIDNSPKSLSKNQINSLKALSKQVMNLIELRKHKTIIEKTLEEVQRRNRELEDFAYIAAHDIKSPLNNISNLADLLKNDYEGVLDNEGKRILNLIKNSSTKLKSLVSGLLKHSQSENLKKEDKEHFSLKQFIDEVWGLFNVDQAISLNFHSTVKEIEVNKTALEQILINLISNAIKYNDKENIEIEIGVNDNVNEYEFYVKDNGPGIDPIYHKQIFNIFEVLTNKDRFQEPGNGIGLATVKKIVHQLDGRIEVKSKINEGAKFLFYLKK
jgi:light-regulated signal transduction histidine kinase (bacteriophytochrome)